MPTITTYDPVTGEIDSTYSGRGDYVYAAVPEDREYVEGQFSPYTHYYDNGMKERPVMAPTVVGLIITGLPVPCSLTTYETTYEITDGEAELSYDLAGEYQVEVKAFPHLDWEVTVNAS